MICALNFPCPFTFTYFICDTSDLKQRLTITKRCRRSCLSMEKAATCMYEGEMTSLWTSAKLNRLFSQLPTVHRGKHVVLRHFCRSYLKTNKISKSKGTVEYAYHFLKVCWCCLPKITVVRISPCLPKLEITACQRWRVFWDTVYFKSN